MLFPDNELVCLITIRSDGKYPPYLRLVGGLILLAQVVEDTISNGAETATTLKGQV